MQDLLGQAPINLPNKTSFLIALKFLLGDKILERLPRSSSDSVSETEILLRNCSTRDRKAICWAWDREIGGAGAGRRWRCVLCWSSWFGWLRYEAQYDGGGSRPGKLNAGRLSRSPGSAGKSRWIKRLEDVCEPVAGGNRYSFLDNGWELLLAAESIHKQRRLM